MKKPCKRCGVSKPLKSYYKHDGAVDGHRGECKECCRDKYRGYRRSIKGQETYRRARVRHAMNPKIHASRGKVARAISNGILKQKPCEHCNEKLNTEGHHVDYSKPLEVIWLCSSCHSKEHAKLRDVSKGRNKMRKITYPRIPISVTFHTLCYMMKTLKDMGHRPGIYLRGEEWRAHVNCASNVWVDSNTPRTALVKAIRLHNQSLRRSNR